MLEDPSIIVDYRTVSDILTAVEDRRLSSWVFLEVLHLMQTVPLLLLLVFNPWAGLGRDQSSVRRLVWLRYAASWASS